MARKIAEYCLENVGDQEGEGFVFCTSCGESVFLDGYGFAPLREDIIEKTLEELEKANQVRTCWQCDHPVIICAECSLKEPVDDSPVCVCCFTFDDIGEDDEDYDIVDYYEDDDDEDF